MKIKISGSGLLYFLSLKALSCRVSPCGNLLQISYELEKKWLRYRLYRVSVVGGVAMAWVACFQRHFSSNWTETWHDDSLDGIDRAQSQKKFKLRPESSITYYVSQSVFHIYLGHFSSEWTEILHDEVIYNIRHFPLRKIPPWKFPRTLPLAASPCI